MSHSAAVWARSTSLTVHEGPGAGWLSASASQSSRVGRGAAAPAVMGTRLETSRREPLFPWGPLQFPLAALHELPNAGGWASARRDYWPANAILQDHLEFLHKPSEDSVQYDTKPRWPGKRCVCCNYSGANTGAAVTASEHAISWGGVRFRGGFREPRNTYGTDCRRRPYSYLPTKGM
jgi:hypothetical protein